MQPDQEGSAKELEGNEQVDMQAAGGDLDEVLEDYGYAQVEVNRKRQRDPTPNAEQTMENGSEETPAPPIAKGKGTGKSTAKEDYPLMK